MTHKIGLYWTEFCSEKPFNNVLTRRNRDFLFYSFSKLDIKAMRQSLYSHINIFSRIWILSGENVRFVKVENKYPSLPKRKKNNVAWFSTAWFSLLRTLAYLWTPCTRVVCHPMYQLSWNLKTIFFILNLYELRAKKVHFCA